jgi:tetratricopeptide (TPR) repeat protein
MVASQPDDTLAVLPDPGQASTVDELTERLRALRAWAGDPSYATITDRINAAWKTLGRTHDELTSKSTVVDCFKPGRRRLNTDLLIAIVQALHPDLGYVVQWRQALRVISGETQAASQVRVQDSLPPDLATFTGRTPELEQLRQALQRARHHGEAVVISAIEGMAGVGKTQLAIHAAHLLTRETALDRVLFVDLRGFHPDPAQPPADPAAVQYGFLRLLGVPGQQIPHDLPARTAAYRRHLEGIRALVVLDNAADAEQVRPLVAGTPQSLTLVTSRRNLTDLQPATRLTMDVFTPDEAIEYLTRAVPEVAVGTDPNAPARIAERCGHLPLALSLVAGHIRGTPGWTLTDHADRLDERRHHSHLDTGVQLALGLSYQHLPSDEQQLLRLAALHPGQDFDAYAAAALTDTDLHTAQKRLHHLCSDHLLQQVSSDRYSFHDLVRAYATSQASDRDPPPQRRNALTRLFDYYLATSATAMNAAYPHEQHLRPIAPSAGTATPDIGHQNRAESWLDTELANLLATAQHAAQHGWPEHTWHMSAILDRHLRTRGRYGDAQTLHQHALDLASQLGNHTAAIRALNGLGVVHRWLSDYQRAADHFWRALQIAQATGDRAGEIDAQHGLGVAHRRQGRYEQAADHYGRALQMAQAIGDRGGETNAQHGLGDVHWILGRYEQAADHYGRALQMAQAIGDRGGEINAQHGLGNVHRMLGRYEQAADHYGRALRMAQAIGDRGGEINALNGLGYVHWRLGNHEEAGDHLGQASQIAQAIGDRGSEINALNGHGNVHLMLGRYQHAGDRYGRALRIARAIGDRGGQLQALTGLGHAHRMLGRHSAAVDCYEHVLDLAREVNSSNWQYEALQGIGRLHHATGQPDLALTHHDQALRYATELSQPTDQARAHDGLAHGYHAKGQHELARQHWQHALNILTSLGTDHTEDAETSVPNIREQLSNLDQQQPQTET